MASLHTTLMLTKEDDFDFRFAMSALGLTKSNQKTFLLYTWSTLFGVAALFDFLSTVVPMWLFVKKADDHRHRDPHPSKVGANTYEFQYWNDCWYETNDPLFIHLLSWLQYHAETIGFIFSLFWFVDVFVIAHRRRDHSIRARDHDALLVGDHISSSSSASGCDDDNHQTATHPNKCSFRQEGAWGVYWATVLLHLLLLPVNFYFVIYHRLHLWAIQDKSKVADDDVTVVIRGLPRLSGVYETFTKHVHAGLGGVILQYFVLIVLQAETNFIRESIFHSTIMLLRSMVQHPILFGRRFRRFQTGLRWAKYLAPLSGPITKFFGNLIDLIKRYKQRRQAQMAENERKRVWCSLSSAERRRHAAICLQSVYRSYYCRKAFNALRLLWGDRQFFAAIKIQKVLRAMLLRVRLRLFCKKRELESLLQKENRVARGIDSKSRQMSVTDRRRLYKLQDELNAVADELMNKGLLLRPHTTLAVTWRFIFVACALFEITILIFQPRLNRHFKDKKTKKPLDIGQIMHQILVPKPISTWDVCAVELHHPNTGPGIIRAFQRLIPWREKAIATISSKWPPRWYCHRHMARAVSWYIAGLKWMLIKFISFLALVSFIDVPISFFIGEIDPKSGIWCQSIGFFGGWYLVLRYSL